MMQIDINRRNKSNIYPYNSQLAKLIRKIVGKASSFLFLKLASPTECIICVNLSNIYVMVSRNSNLLRNNRNAVTNDCILKCVAMRVIHYLLLDSGEASSVSISNDEIRSDNEYVISSKYSESFKLSKESFTGNTLPLVTLSLLQTPNVLHK